MAVNKVDTDLSTLVINRLTKEQYNRALDAGEINENELYLTPDPFVAITKLTQEEYDAMLDADEIRDDELYVVPDEEVYAKLDGDNVFTGQDNTFESVTIEQGIQLNNILAPTTSGGTTYSSGSTGQVLKSNGSGVFWANDYDTVHTPVNFTINLSQGGSTSLGQYLSMAGVSSSTSPSYFVLTFYITGTTQYNQSAIFRYDGFSGGANNLVWFKDYDGNDYKLRYQNGTLYNLNSVTITTVSIQKL